jgi:hypothetical protein
MKFQNLSRIKIEFRRWKLNPPGTLTTYLSLFTNYIYPGELAS